MGGSFRGVHRFRGIPTVLFDASTEEIFTICFVYNAL